MIASSWNLLLVLAHSDSRTTAVAGGSLIVSLLLGLGGVTPVPASREGEPGGRRGCDLAPTKFTEESKVGVEGNGSEKGLTLLEEVKLHKVLKPAAAADGRQRGCGTFGRYLSTSKLPRKKKQHSVKKEGNSPV